MNPRPKDKDKVIPVTEFRKMKVKKEKTLPELKKELDTVFNKFIRQRDAPLYFFRCISCGNRKSIKQLNAGHYFSAGHNEAVRWNEQNVNGQCIRCNKYLHGNLEEYRKGMIKKYGQKVLDDLEIQRHNKSKMMKFEIQFLIHKYKALLKN